VRIPDPYDDGQVRQAANRTDGLLGLMYSIVRQAVRDGVTDALRASGLASSEGARGKYLTTREAAERLRLHPYTVYEMVKQGRIRSVRVGRRILIPESALVGLDHAELLQPGQAASSG
jgi:excisionase family DNA binding protein